MEFYSKLLFQMDLARTLIVDGRIEHLRVALLLLDNAAKMILAAYVESSMVDEKWNEKLKVSWEGMSLVELPEAARQALAFQPLTKTQKKQLSRDFETKIVYATERKGQLSKSVAGPLRHIHRYRNEAYHRNIVRPETIRSACLIMVEIVSEMAHSLKPATISYSSDDDFSWLTERFSLKKETIFLEETPDEMIDAVRDAILPSKSEIVAVLEEYLTDRFELFHDELRSLVGELPIIKDEEEALSYIYGYWDNSVRYPDSDLSRTEIKKRCTLKEIRSLAGRISEMSIAKTRVAAFEVFAQIEELFEPIETATYELLHEIEVLADIELDMARGK